MPLVNGVGTIWNLPNYSGELFTADATSAPLLTLVGGLTGGMVTENFEFPTAQLYNLPEAAQPNISENQEIIAPEPTHIARVQETNVVQIHQEAIDLTYTKLANGGRMSGVNTVGQQPNPSDDFQWQIEQKLVKIARDVEQSFIAGVFVRSTGSAVANRTRGLIATTQLPGGTTVNGNGAALTRVMLDNLYLRMAEAGAMFNNPIMFVSPRNKQVISQIYGSLNGFALPATRNEGGVNITDIEFDFGRFGVVTNRFMPNTAVLLVDIAHVAPVFQSVPDKGILFVEELAKIGASERAMIYGRIGLDHGPAFAHGSITNLIA